MTTPKTPAPVRSSELVVHWLAGEPPWTLIACNTKGQERCVMTRAGWKATCKLCRRHYEDTKRRLHNAELSDSRPL
jgi:hypothetical protein